MPVSITSPGEDLIVNGKLVLGTQPPPLVLWNSLPPMPVSADQLSKVKLLDGKILCVGGNDGSSGVKKECFLFDGVLNKWTSVGDYPIKIENPMLVLLPNGKVLAAGGDTYGYSAPTNVCALYDPIAQTWTLTGTMTTARFSAGFYLLPNGKVLVAGGDNSGLEGYTNLCEIYDPSTGLWAAASAMNHAHAHANYAMMGIVPIIIGGKDGNVSASQFVEAYDYVGDSWSMKASIPVTGTFNDGFNSCVILSTGKLLHVGGRTSGTWSGAVGTETGNCAVYDIGLDAWTVVGSLSQKRDEFSLWLLYGDQAVVAGGFTNNDTTFLSSVELFDPVALIWSTSQSYPTGTTAMDPMGGIVLDDGRAFAAGGFVNVGPSYVTNASNTFDLAKLVQISGPQIADHAISPNH